MILQMALCVLMQYTPAQERIIADVCVRQLTKEFDGDDIRIYTDGHSRVRVHILKPSGWDKVPQIKSTKTWTETSRRHFRRLGVKPDNPMFPFVYVE